MEWTRASAKAHSSFPAGTHHATGRHGFYVITSEGMMRGFFRLQLWLGEPQRSRAIMAKQPWKYIISSGLNSLGGAKLIAEDYERKHGAELPTREAWLSDGRNPRPLEGLAMANVKMPSVAEIVKELKGVCKEYKRMNRGDIEEGDTVDVRLQVLKDGTATVHWGLSDYDTDHHGYWGSGSMSGEETDEELKSIAEDLISQADDSAAQDDEGDEDLEGVDDDEPSEPDEEDWVTEDHQTFYSHGGSHKPVLELEPDLTEAEMWQKITTKMELDGFFPNVWWLSDHGNFHLMTKPSTKRRRSRKA